MRTNSVVVTLILSKIQTDAFITTMIPEIVEIILKVLPDLGRLDHFS